MNTHSEQFILMLADSNLILSQRNAEWCGHGPVLEQDIAITNITLDLLGQARNCYQYAAAIIGNTDEDQLAYLRSEREFRNLLLCELPRGDWAQSVLRQFFFSVYIREIYNDLLNGNDTQLAAIAEKSLKEVAYHIRWTSEWIIRMGDGTAESNQRLTKALEYLWPYTGECFLPADFEQNNGINLARAKQNWTLQVKAILEEASLQMPDENAMMQSGGKQGIHTEQMGFILAEMQYLQRSYPGAQW